MRPTAIATAVFPMPAGPTISTSRSVAEQVGDGRDLGLAPNELGSHGRQVPDRAFRSGVPQGRRQGRATHPGEGSAAPAPVVAVGGRGRARGELVPHPLVRREGVRLPTGAVQRGDQQLPEALLERVRRHRGLAARRSRRRRRRGATGPSNWISRSCPSLFEPGPVRVDPVAVSGRLQHIAAVQRRESTRTGRRQPRSSPALSRRTSGHRVEGGDRIDVSRLDGEPIATIPTHDHGWVAEARGAAWRPSTAACCGECCDHR